MPKPTYLRHHGLTDQQLRAAEFILLGHNDARIAEHLGLARETVLRWRLYDDAFRTHLDRRRRDLWTGAVDAVRSILPAAAETVFDQLRASPTRGRLALDLLTRAGVLGRPYAGFLGTVESDNEHDAGDADDSDDTADDPDSSDPAFQSDTLNPLDATTPTPAESQIVTYDHTDSVDSPPVQT